MHKALAIAGLGALLVAAAAGGSFAAGARASDPISIWSGPESEDPILGRLMAGEEVTIDRCTSSGRWCRVIHDGPTGWVPSDYLVGAAAKADATPLRSLTDPPIDDQRDLGHTRRGFW